MKRTSIVALFSFLLCFASSIHAQHLMRLDIAAEAKAKGMTEERARKLNSGYHPLLFNGTKRNNNGNRTHTIAAKKQMAAKPLAEGISDLKIYGYVPYAEGWTTDRYGIYTFKPKPPILFEKMPDGPDGPVAADGGGCYYDGKYYGVTYAGFMGMVLAEFCVYDTVTWQMEKYMPVAAGTVSTDMDYDATTGNIYGCFYNDNFDGFVFGYVDPSNGKRTEIAPLNRIFFGMSVNSKGEVYGIDEQGKLSKFNKTTGERTVIGDTGVLPLYLGSATFYQKTDELLWSVMNDGGSYLYKVDVNTAHVTEICRFPNSEEVLGMYIPVPAAEPGAPAKAENVKAVFVDGALKGKLAFTMPSKTYSGSTVSGELQYDIYIDDEYYSTGNAAAGANVEADVEVKQYGMYKLSVRPKNAEGLAPVSFVTLWIGKDIPTAVTDITVADGSANGDVVVTWKAPKESVHNGYFTTDGLQYMVQRFVAPGDSVTVAMTTELTITDHIDNQGTMRPYYYKITPIVDGNREGESAYSRSIGIGKALNTPYVQAFDDDSSLDLFTIIDRHNDGKTWSYDPTFQAARANYDWTNPKNDWLITPPLHLFSDRVYKLSFDAWGRDGNMERFEVKYGNGRKYTDLTETAIARTEVTNDTPQNHFKLVQVKADGDFCFGIHAVSDVDKWWLYIDNLKIEDGPRLGTPNCVTAFKAVPAEKGELKTTLSFTAPVNTVDGIQLKGEVTIKVYRGDVLVTEMKAQPGEKFTVTDDNTAQGYNTYTVRVFGDRGEGLDVSSTVYAGVDIPTAPLNVTLKKVNGNAVLTWDAPTTGVNGGYVNPSKVEYYVYRSDSEEIAAKITDRTVTDESTSLLAEQSFITYAVYAQNEAGIDENQYGMSNEVCFGTPYSLPFHESFANQSTDAGPWTWESLHGDPWMKIDASGVYPVAPAQDSDAGLVSYQPENVDDEGVLISSNISLDAAQKPKLKFWYYNNPGTYDKISVRVRIDDNVNKVEELKYINMSDASGEEGWTQVVCDLSKYIDHRIQLMFRFTSVSDYYMYIDNITVDGLRSDLPGVNDLKADVNGNNVTLTWSEPVDEVGLGFIGYNVYRNGKLITDEPIIDPMFEDQPNAAYLLHIYNVTVVYEEGETTFSNNADVEVSGITEIQGESAAAPMYNIGGQRLEKMPKKGVVIVGKNKYIK